MPATISWIAIAPVKGMRLQEVDEAELGSGGLEGDREFFLVDDQNAMISATRLGPLLEIVPESDPRNRTLTLTFPDRAEVSAGIEYGNPESVTLFGQETLARPVLGDFSRAVSEHSGVELRLMKRPDDRPAVDRGAWGAATLLGLASIERLETAAAQAGQTGPIDQRRFRMNFGVDGLGAHEEDNWLGQEIEVGGTRLFVQDMVGRCAATTRDPDRGSVDLKTLHHIASYRGDVVSNEPLPFGVCAGVRSPGTVRVGDPVVAPLDSN